MGYMGCIANHHCCTCGKSLHISGDMLYVSQECNRFSNLHKGHQLIRLRTDKRWESLDNGTNWAVDPIWWKATFDSPEYQEFLAEEKAFVESCAE